MNRNRQYICIPAAALMLAIASGCSDELNLDRTESRDIRFSASIADSPSSDTRSIDFEGLNRYEVLPMQTADSKEGMYLHSEILDWSTPDTGNRGMTRSNIVHSGSEMYGDFSVSAYYYEDAWTADKASYQPNYFYFEGASGTPGGSYDLNNLRYWPRTGKMRFIAFAPYSQANTGAYIMGNVNEQAGPYVHIDIDTIVANRHQDLLVAYSQEFECSGVSAPVALNFKHALACIQFSMADDMQDSRIKKIRITGANGAGDYRFRDNMAESDASSTADASLNSSYHPWESIRNYTLDLTDSENPNGKEVSAGDIITDETHSFMMFPQVLPKGAGIEITLSRKQDDGSWGPDEMMFGYISDKRWPAGKIIRYRVSNNSWWQELQVSKLAAFPPTGGENTFSITSFELDSKGNKQPVVWKVQYEDPSNPGTFVDDNPGWYSFPTTNDGAANPESVTVTATETTNYHEINLDSALKSASPASYGTESNPYNLSTNSTGTTDLGTTANCYIIDRPGWYILPLVYGNAIDGGSENKNAYNPGTDTSNGAINNFVNNLGQGISSPYILTDCPTQAVSIGSKSAKVVWQDHANLIRNTSITVDKTAFGGKGGIVFEVAAGDIIQGNSVIGLEVPGTSSDEMMWSWHIWVTPFFRDGLDPIITETIGISNNEGTKFDMLYTPLGWRSEDPIRIYPPRTSKVRFYAKTSHGTLTKDLTVEQAPFVRFWHGSNTYYQWGRKDPFMPFVKSYNQTWYDSDGNFRYQYPDAEKFGNGVTALQKRILNPSVFQITDETTDATGAVVPANLSVYTNLWNATFSLAPTVNKYDPNAIEPIKIPSHVNVKSVYDPCPPGFKVPPVHTFTGFTTTGNNIGSLTDNPKNWNGTVIQYDYECGGDPAISKPSVYLFYTNPEKTAYIAFPLTGYRDWRSGDGVTSGSSIQMGDYGYSWTAGVASTNQAYYLELMKNDPKITTSDGWVQPLDYFWQVDALPVRPCKE